MKLIDFPHRGIDFKDLWTLIKKKKLNVYYLFSVREITRHDVRCIWYLNMSVNITAFLQVASMKLIKRFLTVRDNINVPGNIDRWLKLFGQDHYEVWSVSLWIRVRWKTIICKMEKCNKKNKQTEDVGCFQ